jgi:succinylglutamate desuccinylase
LSYGHLLNSINIIDIKLLKDISIYINIIENKMDNQNNTFSYEKMEFLAITKENLLKEEEYKNRQLQQENEKLKKQLEMLKGVQQEAEYYKMMAIQKDKDIMAERGKWIQYKAERDQLERQFNYLKQGDLILPLDSGGVKNNMILKIERSN